jgi:hypothetical protein
LRSERLFRYNDGPVSRFNAAFTLIRDLGDQTRANVMPTRRDFRAITRGAQARPGGALILGGLLLLTVP